MKLLRSLLLSSVLCGAGASAALGQVRQLDVNWDHLDLQSYLSTKPFIDLSTAGTDRDAASLRIPVLVPSMSLPLVRPFDRVLATGSGEMLKLVADGGRGAAYSATSKLEGVTIGVDASRLVQWEASDLPGEPIQDGARPDEEPTIQLFDSAEYSEVPIVEATFVRYGIPYTVTVECEVADDKRCVEASFMQNVLASLVIVGGAPE